MDCLACRSSAAVCSSFLSGQECSYPPIRSSVHKMPQNSQTPGSCMHLRCSPLFSRFSSTPEIAAILPFRLSRMIVCTGSSPLQSQVFGSSSTKTTDKVGMDNLSAKERRKLRNERREEAKTAQPWKEMVEDRLMEKKKKISGWEQDADINRCISKGFQWWMIQVTRKFEFQVAEHIAAVFPERFPGKEFEVLVPTVPVRTKLKDGSVSQSRNKLYQGVVLLRCVLDRDVWHTVKEIPRAYEFFGNLAGVSYQPIIMPAPVSNFNMDNMFQQIQEEEEKYEKFKEQCRKEAEEQWREKLRKGNEKKKRDLEEEQMRSKALELEVGATVRVLSGPFTEFRGIVTEILPQVNRVKVFLTVFGKDTPVELDIENVSVKSAAPFK